MNSEPGTAADTTRRRWLYAGVGVAAASAGFAASWWMRETAAGGALPAAGLWDMQFDAPSGSAIAMRQFAGKPLLLNFWATWCPPCIEELPLLNSFFKQNKPNGWQVVGIAVDQLAAVQAFLRHTPLEFPVALAGLPGIELSRALGNLSGALPFTLVLGSSGAVLHRKMGRVTEDDLSAWRTLR